MSVAQLGSISHGTTRIEDLIPVFADKLAQLSDDGNLNDAALLDHVIMLDKDNDGYYVNQEDANEVLHGLFDALNQYAPEGSYFGSHVGDGADYGFWEIEEE